MKSPISVMKSPIFWHRYSQNYKLTPAPSENCEQFSSSAYVRIKLIEQMIKSDMYSMSTGCAVLFGGNIYGFFIFPLGGTTDFLGRFFLKASLTPSMFPNK
jgi:hypothetical protein